MKTSERAKRATLLCIHFARNFAYYSVFHSSSALRVEGFWLTTQGNFLDVCVLEWCKLFGNRNGKYHWSKVVLDPEAFRREMLHLHGITENELKALWDKVKDYRDDFVAHLEDQETTVVPNMNVPYLLTGFYFRKLRLDFPALQQDGAIPQDFDKYYDLCLQQARGPFEYASAQYR